MRWVAQANNYGSNFIRNEVEVRVANQLPSGEYEIVTDWGSKTSLITIKRAQVSNMQSSEDTPLVLPEDLARAIMEALQRHFGAYAGVDYERLRKDYDRVVAENTANNIFIRDTLKTIIEARKPRT